jgi:heat shock protein HtpX
MLKRIFFFAAVNIAVVITISIVLNFLGISGYATDRYGLNLTHLAIFSLVWGMVGSFVSLLISRWMAKMTMGVQLIDPSNPGSTEARDLLNTVYSLSRKAGLTTMPEVGVYQSPDLNAFATGPTKNRSLVAVSSGLLHRMNRDQVEGVLAHEVSHIANGDMVTMTLVQGVVNAFVMFFARIISFFLSQGVDEEKRPMVRFFTTMAAELVLGILGMMVVAAFSRWREFRADGGAAALAGKGKMIAALQGLKQVYEQPELEGEVPASVAAFRISSRPKGLLALFSTHPPLDERIERLRQNPSFGM